MIYDVRMYNLKPGAVNDYIPAVREVGLPLRESHGIQLAGWYYTEIGPLNQIMHIWGYEDMGDMDRKLTALRNDPRWFGEYAPRVVPLLTSGLKSQIMRAPDFFPRPK